MTTRADNTFDRSAQLALFDRRFDIVSITVTIRAHNVAGLRDAIVRAYGGPPTTCLFTEDWHDIDGTQDDVLLADIGSVLCELVDRHFGPF